MIINIENLYSGSLYLTQGSKLFIYTEIIYFIFPWFSYLKIYLSKVSRQ